MLLRVVIAVLVMLSCCVKAELPANEQYCYQWCLENLPKHLKVSKARRDLALVKRDRAVWCKCSVQVRLPVKVTPEKR